MASIPHANDVDRKDETQVEDISSNEFERQAVPELQDDSRMNKAKWLALFALGLSYMTAFQQSACIGAIVKTIDEALGGWHYEFHSSCSSLKLIPSRTDHLLQLDHHCLDHHLGNISSTRWRIVGHLWKALFYDHGRSRLSCCRYNWNCSPKYANNGCFCSYCRVGKWLPTASVRFR
jgi:hypothetical protein